MKRLLLTCVAMLSLCMLTGCARIRPPKRVDPVTRTFTVTGYCRCGSCCGWKRTWYGRPVVNHGSRKGQRKRVGITSSGTRARVGTVAADIRRYPYGTVMHIPGYGYGRVEDIGGKIKGEHIDLFFSSHKKALEWGKKRLSVKVWITKK